MSFQLIVGFSRPKKETLVSEIIRSVENTSYSHVYVRFYSKKIDRWTVYHANIDGVHFLNFDKFKEKNIPIEEFVIDATPEERIKALQFCIDQAAIKYGSLQLVGMGIARLAKLWFGTSIKNPWADRSKRQVCSELVGLLLLDVFKLSSISRDELETKGPKYINSCLFKEMILGLKHNTRKIKKIDYLKK